MECSRPRLLLRALVVIFSTNPACKLVFSRTNVFRTVFKNEYWALSYGTNSGNPVAPKRQTWEVARLLAMAATLSASMSFPTMRALAGPPSGFTPVSGTLSGAGSVSSFGQAQYSIPIMTPPGVQGIEPNLTLSYSSGSGLGSAGYGWSLLSGQQSIRRCRQTVAQDTVAASSTTALHTTEIDVTPTPVMVGDPWCLTLVNSVFVKKTEPGAVGSGVSERTTTYSPDLATCRNTGETRYAAADDELKSILSYGYDTFGNRTRTAHKAHSNAVFANTEPFQLKRNDVKYDDDGYFPEEIIQCVGDGETGTCGEDDANNPSSTLDWDDTLGMMTANQILTKCTIDESVMRQYDRFG